MKVFMVLLLFSVHANSFIVEGVANEIRGETAQKPKQRNAKMEVGEELYPREPKEDEDDSSQPEPLAHRTAPEIV
jgi:hypothetical protein